jgi:predicted nucleic acid-binding protein
VGSGERTAFDTSVVVAALASWHERHREALAALQDTLARPAFAVLPLPVLIETYSVMTRLPPPHRLSPRVVADLLAGTFRSKARVVALSGTRGWPLIEAVAAAQVAGGVTYDALIVETARRGRARRLLTFNTAHFARLTDPTWLELVDPGRA